MPWLKSQHSDRVLSFDDVTAQRWLTKGYRIIEGEELTNHLQRYDIANTDGFDYVVYNPQINYLFENANHHYGYAVLNDITDKQLRKANILQVSRNIKDRPFFASGSVTEAFIHSKRTTPFKIYKTNWEAKTLPKHYVNELNRFDAILTGRPFAIEVFQNSGVTVPIYYQPDGINQEYLVDLKRPKRKTFTFLHYNGGEWRKNTMGVLTAFIEQFSNQPEVRLVIKNSGIQRARAEQYREFIQLVHPEMIDRIEIITQKYTVSEMLELAKRSDCFVFPTYGEGYGMPPLEMMATGMPAIIPLEHSFREIPDDCVLPIDISGSIQGRKVYAGAELWKPSQTSLKKQMQWAVDNPSKLQLIAQKGKAYVHKTENDKEIIKYWKKNFKQILDK